jgi:hypothetical protein
MTPSSANRIISVKWELVVAGGRNGEADYGNRRSGHGIFMLDEAVRM